MIRKELPFLLLSVALLLGACSKAKEPNDQNSTEQHGPTETEMADIRRSACKEDRIDIQETAKTPDLYVDYRYLPVVLGNLIKNRPGRLRLPVTDTEIVSYMLSTGWTAIETEQGRHMSIRSESEPDLKVYRFQVRPEGSPECKGYGKQYEYPLQTLPELREMGVLPGQCIGVSELAAPSAKGRIQVKRQRLYVDPKDSGSYDWRVDVTASVVRDGATVREVGVAVQHMGVGTMGQHGDGALHSLCGKNFPSIAPALRPTGEGDLQPPELVVKDTAEATSFPEMGREEFESLKWLETADRYKSLDSYYSIDQRGEMWTTLRNVPKLDWAFHVVQPGRILVTALPREDEQIRYSTRAFSKTRASGYAVLVQRQGETTSGRLFEFDRELNFVGSFKLNSEQVREALLRSRQGKAANR